MTPEQIEALFPLLREEGYSITSPEDPEFNCVAWAAEDVTYWWWPVGQTACYWPTPAPLEVTLESFRIAFETLGYEACENSELEPEYVKVAIYADHQGTPTHVAKQTAAGVWSSKLGRGQDIEHSSLRALEGLEYGTPVLFLRRPHE